MNENRRVQCQLLKSASLFCLQWAFIHAPHSLCNSWAFLYYYGRCISFCCFCYYW